MKLTLASLVLLVFSISGLAQSQRLQDLNVNFMLRGYFFAGSRIIDKDAFGGFGSSDNLSKPIDSSMHIPDGDISVIAYADEAVPFSVIAYADEAIPFDSKYRGLRVILANTTGDRVGFSASDSRLYMIQEAIDTDGKWKPIEYLPSSWCGNSYHTVYLPSQEYWEFAAARYTGARRTRLRIKLFIEHPAQKSRMILSNELEGGVNSKQFTVQQGHTPGSVMDPYNN